MTTPTRLPRPTGRAAECPAGVNGFDCDAPVSANAANAFRKAGYRFAVRYVPRLKPRSNDLSIPEISRLHQAGIAVSIVQHVESDASWEPTPEKGQNYGRVAATTCKSLGVPAGVTVWLDLEGVATFVPAAVTIMYARLWFTEVKGAGYQPGLYVGWHAGLDAQELYRLPFARYWAAYNLNVDQRPARVGVCMKQRAARPGDLPKGVDFPIDTDLVTGDLIGRLPVMWAPDEWSVPV